MVIYLIDDDPSYKEFYLKLANDFKDSFKFSSDFDEIFKKYYLEEAKKTCFVVHKTLLDTYNTPPHAFQAKITNPTIMFSGGELGELDENIIPADRKFVYINLERLIKYAQASSLETFNLREFMTNPTIMDETENIPARFFFIDSGDNGVCTESLKEAMLLRLNLALCETKKDAIFCRAPIICCGLYDLDFYLNSFRYSSPRDRDFASILTTQSVYFVKASSEDEVKKRIDSGELSPKELPIGDFKSGVLDRIKINPNGGDNHTIANDWGAFIASRFLGNAIFEKHKDKVLRRDEPYLLYLLLSAQTEDGLKALAKGENSFLKACDNQKLTLPECTGKKVLLIDDQDTVWADIIHALLPEATLTVWGKSSPNKHTETPYTYVQNILEGKEENAPQNFLKDFDANKVANNYDLILLDLRLGGHCEENPQDIKITPGDYPLSGLRVLKQLMAANQGCQVIILTSSNKAWNMQQALLHEKALGYYIKESPLFLHTPDESRKNLEALISDIDLAFQRAPLRQIYNIIFKNNDSALNLNNKLIDHFNNSDKHLDYLTEIDYQINSSWFILLEASLLEEKNINYAYAYLALFQVLEIIKKMIISTDNSERKIDNDTPIYECLKQKLNLENDDSDKALIQKRNDFIHANKPISFDINDYHNLLTFIKKCILSLCENNGVKAPVTTDSSNESQIDEIRGYIHFYEKKKEWQFTVDNNILNYNGITDNNTKLPKLQGRYRNFTNSTIKSFAEKNGYEQNPHKKYDAKATFTIKDREIKMEF